MAASSTNILGLEKARALFAASRFRSACTAFSPYVHVAGHVAEAHVGCGKALAALGNFEEAAVHFVHALRSDPVEKQAYEELDAIWGALDSRDSVLMELNRFELAGMHPGVRIAWAMFLEKRGEMERSLAQHAEAGEAAHADAESLTAWARCAASAGQHEEALERHAAAIAMTAGEPDAHWQHWEGIVASAKALGTTHSAVERLGRRLQAMAAPAVRSGWAAALWALGCRADSERAFQGAAESNPPYLPAWLGWASALLHNGNAARALEVLEKALGWAPDNPQLLSAVRNVLMDSPQPDQRLPAFAQARASASTAPAHVEWARTMLAVHQAAAAAGHFEAAFRLSPTDVELAEWMGALQEADGSEEGSAALGALLPIQRAVEGTPVASVHVDWASQLAGLGMTLAALEHLQRYARSFPGDAQVAAKIAEILHGLGRGPDALEVLVTAMEASPHDITMADPEVAGQVRLCLSGQPPEARRAALERLQPVLALSDEQSTQLEWGNAFSAAGEHGRACEQYERALAKDPRNPSTLVALANALAAAGKDARAADAYVRALKESSGEPDVVRAACEGLKVLFMRMESERHLAAATAAIVAIDGSRAYREWALVMDSIEFLGATAKYLALAVEKQPWHPGLRSEYANRLVLCGDAEKGLAEHLAAEARDAEAPFVHASRAHSLRKLRRYQEALDCLQRASDLGGEDLQFEWAVALHESGRLDASIEKYRNCSAGGGCDPVLVTYCRNNIGHVLEQQGDYAAARKEWADTLACYEQAAPTARANNRADFFVYYGNLLIASAQDQEAAERQHLEALRMRPTSAFVQAAVAVSQLNRVEHLSRTGSNAGLSARCQSRAREAHAAAKRLFRKQLQDSEIPWTLVELGQLHLAFSENDEAAASFARAVELDPHSTEAWSGRAQAALRTDDFRLALKCARKAVSCDANDLTARTLLAEAHQKSNELERAEIEYAAVLKAAPCHVGAQMGLARTYLTMGTELQKSGQMSDAEDMFSQALRTLCHAMQLSDNGTGSKVLTPGERAEILYRRGYALAMQYEAQPVVKRDNKLLDAALSAFAQIPGNDPNHAKASRAMIKIRHRTSLGERAARWGGWFVAGAATLVLVVANLSFVVGKPGLTRTYQVTQQSVGALRLAKVPPGVLGKLEALAARGELTKTSFDVELKSALGEEFSKLHGDTVRQQAATHLTPGWQESIDAGYYALLSFGALIFIIAGLFLQQLSKLKFGGFELEKTSEATSTVFSSLGITPLKDTSRIG